MPLITPAGVETLVNSNTSQNQAQSVITSLANGQYVVVWVDYILSGAFNAANTANADLRGRIFNADGTPAGAEFTINTTLTAAQIFPTVTTLSDGNFLVGWQDGVGTVIGGAASPPATIRAQEFTAAGVAVGSEFALGSGGERFFPSISALPGGGFVAAWQAGPLGAYVAQVYDANNIAVGSAFTIDSTNVPAFGRVIVTTLDDGNIAFAWTTGINDASGGVTARVFTVGGAPVTGELHFSIPNDANFATSLHDIQGLSGGHFAIAWSGNSASFNVAYGNLVAYTNAGVLASDENFIMNAANTIFGAQIAALPNGGAVVTWGDGGNLTDGSGSAIRYAAFNGFGNEIGNGGQVNATANGSQTSPAVAVLSNGDIVFTWSDPSGALGDTSGTGIHMRRYDYDPVNQAPVAIGDVFVATGIAEVFDASELTDNDQEPDGDPLIVTSISNVQGGSVNFDFVNQTFSVSYANGASTMTFDYTVSDGNGLTSTAQARTMVTRDDFVTVRGPFNSVNFLANDYLPTRPDGYSISLQNTANSNLVSFTLSGSNESTVMNVSTGYPSVFGLGYAFLEVGQTLTQQIIYTVINPVTQAFDYQASTTITLQGWAQNGGTGFDYLVGGAQADHLIGGSGAANILQGGAGDDWYTVTAAGDSVIEFAGEGQDAVFTTLATYVLADNIEGLTFTGTTTTAFLGIGNASNNQILGRNARDELYGREGNDFLSGGAGGDGFENTMFGGTGDDIYVVGVLGDSTVEYAGEGTDTVRTTFSVYGLQANIENLSFTNTAAHAAGVGNELDNVITGNTGADGLYGRAGNDRLVGGSGAANTLLGQEGNDTYVVTASGDSVIEFAGEGTDTVETSLAAFTLSNHVENLTYSGSFAFTGIGNDLANMITGGSGVDFLSGLDGDDILIGAGGGDMLLGGNGADQFRMTTSGSDRILDFVSGTDKIGLLSSTFALFGTLQFETGASATTNSSTILYNAAEGALYWDADGNGSGAAVQFAALNIGQSVAIGDFVFV